MSTTDDCCSVCQHLISSEGFSVLRAIGMKSKVLKRSNKPAESYLWNYLYHKNVRESISFGNGSGSFVSPKLSFAFSTVDSSIIKRNDETELCEECWNELEKLDKLLQELEDAKKTIESQVMKISSRRHEGDEGKLNSIRKRPPLQISLAGEVVGNGNIVQALEFLGNLCGGIPFRSFTSPSWQSGLSEPTGSERHSTADSQNTKFSENLQITLVIVFVSICIYMIYFYNNTEPLFGNYT